MCKKNLDCQKPERLKDTPPHCSPEQVEECHGNDGKHPCVTSTEEKPQKSK